MLRAGERAVLWERVAPFFSTPLSLSLLHPGPLAPKPTPSCNRSPDLIIEVAHPVITEAYGAALLKVADVLFGSPTAFANAALEAELRAIASAGPNTLWVPAGALWGAQDIQKMADRGALHVCH